MGLHVSLTDELETMIHNHVKSGLYQNASEVVREALRNFFIKPTEGQVMAYFVKKRLAEMGQSGEGLIKDPGLANLKLGRNKIKAELRQEQDGK